MIFEEIEDKIKRCLADSKSDQADFLRLVKSMILLEVKDQGLPEVTDQVCIKVINGQIAKTKKVIDLFEKSKQSPNSSESQLTKADQTIEQNQQEIATLEKFLPTQLTDEELQSAIESELESNPLERTQVNFGKFMESADRQVWNKGEPSPNSSHFKRKG